MIVFRTYVSSHVCYSYAELFENVELVGVIGRGLLLSLGQGGRSPKEDEGRSVSGRIVVGNGLESVVSSQNG